jgi:hypothetical protein
MKIWQRTADRFSGCESHDVHVSVAPAHFVSRSSTPTKKPSCDKGFEAERVGPHSTVGNENRTSIWQTQPVLVHLLIFFFLNRFTVHRWVIRRQPSPHAVNQDHHQCSRGHGPVVNRPVHIGEQPKSSVGSLEILGRHLKFILIRRHLFL